MLDPSAGMSDRLLTRAGLAWRVDGERLRVFRTEDGRRLLDLALGEPDGR